MYKWVTKVQMYNESGIDLTHAILLVCINTLCICIFAKTLMHFEKKDKILSTHLAKA